MEAEGDNRPETDDAASEDEVRGHAVIGEGPAELAPDQARGRPRPRVATMLRWTSLVPPAIVAETLPR